VSGIYKSRNEYLRIGKREKIKKDLELHKKMEVGKFPIAPLVSEGALDGQYYFVESSLGEKHLGELFAEDVLHNSAISDKNFGYLLNIAERFGGAQLETKTNTENLEDFTNGIHLDVLCKELPHCSQIIQSRFESVLDRLSIFPFVVTHGDFNPNNLYPTGVIDLEDSFYGFFGYDLITAIVHINYFPDWHYYEFFAHYRFTQKQQEKYFAMIDSLSVNAGLPALSDFTADFEFCRAVWSLVRMHKWPKIQRFRYDYFIEKFLNNWPDGKTGA
jgi:hypothetical protein